jgi:hypothetical protein
VSYLLISFDYFFVSLAPLLGDEAKGLLLLRLLLREIDERLELGVLLKGLLSSLRGRLGNDATILHHEILLGETTRSSVSGAMENFGAGTNHVYITRGKYS